MLSQSSFFGNILNGNGAVELFFVLSGLVLSLSLERGRDRITPWMLSFYVRRVLRIYPAPWVSLALGLLLLPFERGSCIDSFCTEFAKAAFGTDFTRSQIILSFAGISSRINRPMWSLRTELLYSPLMPGIIWELRKNGVRWLYAMFVFLVSVGPFPRIYSLHYAAAFTLGSAIPLLHAENRRLLFASLFLIALGVMVFDRQVLMPFDVDLKTFELIEICEAFFIVYAIYQRKVDLKFLRGASVFYIGEISYSIYLLHWSLLYATAYALKMAAGSQEVLINPKRLYGCARRDHARPRNDPHGRRLSLYRNALLGTRQAPVRAFSSEAARHSGRSPRRADLT